MKRDTIEVYKDAADRWRWRYVAQNGNVLADSGQSYTRRVDAVRAALEQAGLEAEVEAVGANREDVFVAATHGRADDGGRE